MTFGPALLFCPGDRPDRFGKAAAAADTAILDLEDAVAVDAKPAARLAVSTADLDPDRTLVRINPVGGDQWQADLEMLANTGFRRLMLAKASGPADVDAVVAALPGAEVLAICETATGVVRAFDIASHPAVVGLMWGAEDLLASLGGTSSRGADGRYRDVARHARSTVLLACGAAGTFAVDAVHLDIPDLAGLAEEAADAVASGFAGTACIHPSQVPVVREAYRPAPERLEWAHAVLAAAETEGGVFRFRDQMIDEPLLAQARATLARG